MNRTSIEWCRTYHSPSIYSEGYSVNPVRFRPTGSERLTTMCQMISPGCKNCYAKSIVQRFWPKDSLIPFPGYTAEGINSGQFVLDLRQIDSVLKHKKPCRIFWGDMTDLFGEWVPDELIYTCLAVAGLTPHITHIFLTKRPERMAKLLAPDEGGERSWREAMVGMEVGRMHLVRTGAPVSEWSGYPMPNVILGTSIESQSYAEDRYQPMLDLAADRWRTMVSYEPALGPVDWTGWEFLSWLISGGESGSNARPSHPDWHRVARRFCAANNIPYFFKQWGAWQPTDQTVAHARGIPLNDCMSFVGKKAAGNLLDGKQHHNFPT